MTRNVVLLILDTVRKDYFDEFAPRLRSLGDVSFEQCRTASSCSVPSHASILTGELAHKHGIHSASVDYSRLDEDDTFLVDLPEHRRIGVSANTFAGSPFGFDDLFDEFVDVSWTRRFPRGKDAREFVTHSSASGLAFYVEFVKTALGHDAPFQSLGNAAMAQLDEIFARLPLPKLLDDGANSVLRIARRRIESGEEPFFLFVNLMEAHTPHQPTLGYDQSLYDAPNSWSSTSDINQWEINRTGTDGVKTDIGHFRDLYAASIDYLDRKVTAFVEEVRASTDGETTFVITADHGENLGHPEDDGLFGHNSSLSEALLHVPLTIVNPPEGYAREETEYFTQLELGRLVAGLAAEETPDVFAERVAAERLLTANVPDVDEDERAYWNRMLRCVFEGERKVVWDSLGECIGYELDRDRPCWQRKRPEEPSGPPSWSDEFFDTDIRSTKANIGGSAIRDVDATTRSRLEELGYL